LLQINNQIDTLIKTDDELNCLFHLLTSIAGIGAVSATQFILTTQAFSNGKNAKQGELQDYYQRKVKEGKNKRSVFNAVCNKLVLRVFAVVAKNQKL
jgi:hypothetical protein